MDFVHLLNTKYYVLKIASMGVQNNTGSLLYKKYTYLKKKQKKTYFVLHRTKKVIQV